MAKAHGGEISVEPTALEGGAAFTITLPRLATGSAVSPVASLEPHTA
ncbi:MAG: hypothetical protein ACYTFT_09475 [Planctomycetota bacterium]